MVSPVRGRQTPSGTAVLPGRQTEQVARLSLDLLVGEVELETRPCA
jgi:hypothetical protein